MAKKPSPSTKNPASSTKKPASLAKKPAPKANPTTAKEPAKAAPNSPLKTSVRRRVMPWLIASAGVLAVGLLIWAKLAGPLAEEPVAALKDPVDAQMEQRIATIEARLNDDNSATRLSDLDASLSSLDKSLAGLDQRLAGLEARPPINAEQADLVPLEARLAALEARAQETPDGTMAGGTMASEDFEARIAALEARPVINQDAAPTTAPAATLLAIAQLRTALDGSGPYNTALTALEAVGGLDLAAALEVLKPDAGTGIPSLARLRDRFTALADAILSATIAAPEGTSWVSRTLARLSGMVTVRRVGGDVTGESAEAIVARAEAWLAAGDLAAAVAEVAGLDGASAEAAASWLGQARARLAADSALAALDAQVLAAMGGG